MYEDGVFAEQLAALNDYLTARQTEESKVKPNKRCFRENDIAILFEYIVN